MEYHRIHHGEGVDWLEPCTWASVCNSHVMFHLACDLSRWCSFFVFRLDQIRIPRATLLVYPIIEVIHFRVQNTLFGIPLKPLPNISTDKEKYTEKYNSQREKTDFPKIFLTEYMCLTCLNCVNLLVAGLLHFLFKIINITQ